jgi:hypothetical protein
MHESVFGLFPPGYCLELTSTHLSAMVIHRRMHIDAPVRVYTYRASVILAKMLSLATRPSVERSPDCFGNKLLGKTLVTSLMRMCLDMGVRRSTHPMSTSKSHSPGQLLHHKRCMIHLSKSLATHFWCQAIVTTVSSETRI